MGFSLLVAFVVTPWASMRLLRRDGHRYGHAGAKEGWTTRLYRRAMTPLINRRRARLQFLGLIVALLLFACSLVAVRFVVVKMLPFDNKSEFQVILNTPEGTTLEQTTAIAQELGAALEAVPEVAKYQIHAGTSGPYNFNGLVRHYFLRRGPNVADLQVNLVPRHARKRKSHDVAKRVRPDLTAIARAYATPAKLKS